MFGRGVDISQDANGAITRGPRTGGSGMDWNSLAANGAQFLGGATGNSGAPFDKAMDQYNEFTGRSEGAQNPFLRMGQGAIPQMQEWLAGQKDPSSFINHLMNGYNQSPWAKYQQEQMQRTAQNMGSRGDMGVGGLGSTPLMQFAQQNAQNISSQDMNQWLSHVLGINTQYGQGLGNEITGGQNAANSLTQMYSDMAKSMAEAAAGKQAGEDEDKSNMWGGLLGTAGTVLGSMYGGPVGGMAGGAIGSKIGNSFG